MNSAEKCRANGWTAGTILVGDEGYGSTVIEITAVGEELVLAKIISYTGESPHQWQIEQGWTLEYRDWREVPPYIELTSSRAASSPLESPHQWQKEQSWTLEYRDWREVPPNVPSDRLAEDKQEG